MKKSCVIVLLIAFCLSAFGATSVSVCAESGSVPAAEEVRSVADEIISWKKRDLGASEDGFLINDALLSVAGSTAGDWFPLALSRLGEKDNQSGYIAVINDNVQKRYDDESGVKLDRYKATEWHRIALGLLACGGDPRHAGNFGDIDLIADGTYNRVDNGGKGMLGRQGINGFIWGLIALDSGGWEVPDGAYYSREDIINEILSLRLGDGGWALSGKTSDPDITAMAVQCFAPYYDSNEKVRAAVDGALAFLSAAQTDDGDYFSWGMQNCESTAQVIIALTSLNINPFTDSRFIKMGPDGKSRTLWDGIMKYGTPDGGFAHSFVNDADNPSAIAGKANSMASEQTLCALASVLRFYEKKPRLYDMRDVLGSSATGEFTQDDIDEINSLPAPLTTLYRAEVLRLYAKLLQSGDVDGKYELVAKLEKAKNDIDAILAEVDGIKRGIIEKLYPFDGVALKDRKAVYELWNRYNALSDYDKTLFSPSDAEGLKSSKTRVDNALTAVIVSVCVSVAVCVIAVCAVLSIRKRKKLKREKFPEESDE